MVPVTGGGEAEPAAGREAGPVVRLLEPGLRRAVARAGSRRSARPGAWRSRNHQPTVWPSTNGQRRASAMLSKRGRAAVLIAATASLLSVPLGSAPASAASASTAGVTAASASASTPGPKNPAAVHAFTHTFTLRHNGPAVTETCAGVVDIRKSSSYPGYIKGLAWVEGCAPYPGVTCSQTADIQVKNPYTGVWNSDGDGPTTHGCAGRVDASIRKNNCYATNHVESYRTMGIFVVIDSHGDRLVWHGPSGTLNVTRIC
jgi:hypothetical protein